MEAQELKNANTREALKSNYKEWYQIFHIYKIRVFRFPKKKKKKKKFIERRPLCRVIFTPIHKIRKMNEPWGMVRQLVVASQG